MSLAERERVVVATLLCDFPSEPLPATIAQVLSHAPESFADERLGWIAVAIRELNLDAKPVVQRTVVEKLKQIRKLEQAGGALFVESPATSQGSLASHAITIEIAEHEAELVWQANTERLVTTSLQEAMKSIESQPSAAVTIARGIIQSLEHVTNGCRAKKNFSVRTPSELIEMEFGDGDRILGDRLLEKGGSLTIVGASGVGKSRLLLQLAIASITGQAFVGFETRGDGLKWLMLQGENSNRRLKFDCENFRAWCGPKWGLISDRIFIHTLEQDTDGFLALDDPQNVSRLSDLIAKIKPDVVCFDTLNNFAIGDLNKDADMKVSCEAISRLVRHGNPDRACIVLHSSSRVDRKKRRVQVHGLRSFELWAEFQGSFGLDSWPNQRLARLRR